MESGSYHSVNIDGLLIKFVSGRENFTINIKTLKYFRQSIKRALTLENSLVTFCLETHHAYPINNRSLQSFNNPVSDNFFLLLQVKFISTFKVNPKYIKAYVITLLIFRETSQKCMCVIYNRFKLTHCYTR